LKDDGTPHYRCYDPEAVAKIKPIKAVQKLMVANTPKSAMHMSKTVGPKGFGIKRESVTADNNEGR
jgi:hypothetical protein